MPSKCAAGTEQSGVHFVTPTVPVRSRPIPMRLVWNGRPLSPTPSSRVLSGRLPKTAVRAWSGLGAQYIAELTGFNAAATITSASAEVSQTELDEVEETILDVEDLLKEVEGLTGEDNPSVEDLLDIVVDELDSDNDMSPGRYSRLE